MAKKTELSSNGTSFHNVTLKTIPQKLIDLFPDSFVLPKYGGKLNLIFTLGIF